MSERVICDNCESIYRTGDLEWLEVRHMVEVTSFGEWPQPWHFCSNVCLTDSFDDLQD